MRRAFLLAGLLAFAVPACGGGGGSAPGGPPPPTATPVPTATQSTVPTTPPPPPTATPSATPTPGPCAQGAFRLSSCSLSFSGTGASRAQQENVSETGYGGVFTAQLNDCGSIVVVSPASGLSFTVTPNAAGTCTLKFVDANNNAATVPITVTITQVGGQ